MATVVVGIHKRNFIKYNRNDLLIVVFDKELCDSRCNFIKEVINHCEFTDMPSRNHYCKLLNVDGMLIIHGRRRFECISYFGK